MNKIKSLIDFLSQISFDVFEYRMSTTVWSVEQRYKLPIRTRCFPSCTWERLRRCANDRPHYIGGAQDMRLVNTLHRTFSCIFSLSSTSSRFVRLRLGSLLRWIFLFTNIRNYFSSVYRLPQVSTCEYNEMNATLLSTLHQASMTSANTSEQKWNNRIDGMQIAFGPVTVRDANRNCSSTTLGKSKHTKWLFVN